MESPNYHIVDYLTWYANLEVAPGYAVMVNGDWGSGKTWLIKDLVARHVNASKRKWLFVSLYGLTSTRDIDIALFRAANPIKSSKIGRAFTDLLKKKLSFDIGLAGAGDSGASLSANLSLPDEWLAEIGLADDSIVVMDDVERSGIPISDVIGYVNQIVEHGGNRVVMVANDKAIEDRDAYGKAREKVIGHTLTVVPCVEDALRSFVASLGNHGVKSLGDTLIKELIDVYNSSGYRNLRAVRCVLLGLDRVTQLIQPPIRGCSELLRDFVGAYMCRGLELHCGKIGPEDIRVFDVTEPGMYMVLANKANSDVAGVVKKYRGALEASRLRLPPQLWRSILVEGSIPIQELNQALAASAYFASDESPTWIRYWNWENLSDEEFESLSADLRRDLVSKSLSGLGEVLHVAGMFLHYTREGLLGAEFNLVNEAMGCITHLVNQDLAAAVAWERDARWMDGYGGVSVHVSAHRGMEEPGPAYQCMY